MFSDIHNNYFALKAFYDYVKKASCEEDHLYFLGDLIGYLKFDRRIIDLFSEIYSYNYTVMLMGNHDAAFSNSCGSTDFNIKLSPALRDTIINTQPFKNLLEQVYPIFHQSKLRINFFNKDFVLSHGGITDVLNHYYYPDLCFIDKYDDFFEKNTVYVFGHTHRPFIVKNNTNTFVNVGSIGQPRDNDPRLSFLEITDKGEKLNRIYYPLDNAYDYNEGVDNKIRNRIYFGGRSSFDFMNLVEIEDECRILSEIFNDCHCFKRGCYINYHGNTWQVFRLETGNDKMYLLRGLGFEKPFSSLNDVIRRLENETL